MKSRDEREFGERKGQSREGNTFWVRSDSDEESRVGEDLKEGADGGIRKTVRVSVQEGVRTSSREERDRNRMESIMVKLEV